MDVDVIGLASSLAESRPKTTHPSVSGFILTGPAPSTHIKDEGGSSGGGD